MEVVQKYEVALKILDLDIPIDIIEITKEDFHGELGRHFSFSTPYKGHEDEHWMLEGEVYFNPEYDEEIDTPRALTRYKTFIESVGVEYNEYNVDTFIVLHEIGHIVLNQILLKEKLYQEGHKMIEVMHNTMREEHIREDKPYFMPFVMDFMEQWCDNYAKDHYLKLVKAIEETKQMEEINNGKEKFINS